MKLLREKLFTLRSYTPIPFLLVMIIFAQPTVMTMMVGVVLVAFGELMRFWGVAYAGSLTRVTDSVGAPEVIVAGPFSYVRNPLYVGNMLTYIGVGVMSNALFPWLVSAAAVYFAFQYYQIVLAEEEFLISEFGVGYVEYKKNVPRFIPRVIPYAQPSQMHQQARWHEAVRSERRTFQALGLVLLVLLVLWYMR
ncbi:MAG: isoprenylcysteine carboxylmethyltransferase family protein [Bacteroidota bacterium]